MYIKDGDTHWTGKIYVYSRPEHGFLTVTSHNNFDEGDPSYVLIGVSEEITVPFFAQDEIVSKQVTALRAHRQEVLAKSQAQLNEIDQQIQSLLAIEHKQEGE